MTKKTSARSERLQRDVGRQEMQGQRNPVAARALLYGERQDKCVVNACLDAADFRIEPYAQRHLINIGPRARGKKPV